MFALPLCLFVKGSLVHRLQVLLFQTVESIYHSTGCFSPYSTSRVIKNACPGVSVAKKICAQEQAVILS